MPTPSDFKPFDFSKPNADTVLDSNAPRISYFQDVQWIGAAPDNRQFTSRPSSDPMEAQRSIEDQLAKDLEVQDFLMNSGMTPGSPHTFHPMSDPQKRSVK
jgi:hypothetical protein